MYGSTFNLCGPLYTGSTIFIYGGPHRLIFLILKGDFSICVVQSPYLFRGGGGGDHLIFLILKRRFVLALLRT